MTTTVDDDNKVQGIVLLTEEASKVLTPREEIAYKEHRRELAEWMLNLGKNPGKAEGYSHSTAKNRMNKLDLFYRWVWDREQCYVQDLTVEHAEAWMRDLAKQDLKESTKCRSHRITHPGKTPRTSPRQLKQATGRDLPSGDIQTSKSLVPVIPN